MLSHNLSDFRAARDLPKRKTKKKRQELIWPFIQLVNLVPPPPLRKEGENLDTSPSGATESSVTKRRWNPKKEEGNNTDFFQTYDTKFSCASFDWSRLNVVDLLSDDSSPFGSYHHL